MSVIINPFFVKPSSTLKSLLLRFTKKVCNVVPLTDIGYLQTINNVSFL